MSIDQEIIAMSKISEVLSQFGEEDQEVIHRILRWVCDRYSLEVEGEHAAGNKQETISGEEPGRVFEDPASLFHAVSPKTEAERAHSIAYWLQYVQGHKDFSSHDVNRILKDMGFKIANITDAMTSLMKRKPALAIQIAKSGSARQARKKYRLTTEGVRAIETRMHS